MTRAPILALLLAAGVAEAQESPPPTALQVEPAVLPGVVPGPPPPADQVDDRARVVAAGLRCPVCQGLSVADSASTAATQMHQRIRDLVAAGYTREQIEDYFVSKYGEWVLLEPRSGGLNDVVWVGPLVLLGLALAVSASVLRRRPSAEDRDPDTVIDEPATAVTSEDPYLVRLLREVDDD